MVALFTAHYLFIPSDTTQPIREVDIPFGDTRPEQLNHLAQIRQVLGGPINKQEMIYSDDVKNQLLEKPRHTGDKITSYEAYLLGDTILPLNTRAAELLLTPAHQPLHGPVLLSMTHCQLLGPFNTGIRTGSGRPTVAHLQSEEFRKKRKRLLRLLDEKGVESVLMGLGPVIPEAPVGGPDMTMS